VTRIALLGEFDPAFPLHPATIAACTPSANYCNFGVNPERDSELQRGDLRVTATDAEGEVRVVELPDHPFYIGTLSSPNSGRNSSVHIRC
jgi:hypothetical protein